MAVSPSSFCNLKSTFKSFKDRKDSYEVYLTKNIKSEVILLEEIDIVIPFILADLIIENIEKFLHFLLLWLINIFYFDMSEINDITIFGYSVITNIQDYYNTTQSKHKNYRS